MTAFSTSPETRPAARVSAVQFRAIKGDLEGSRARLVSLVREAAKESDFVVCPELAVSGYVFRDKASLSAIAETRDGPTIRELSNVARETGAWIVVGFAERAGEAYFNSAAVLSPTAGLVHVYHKSMLFDLDVPWATAGEGAYPAIDTPFGRLGVGICMDFNDLRFRAWAYRAGIDILALPTAWLDEGLDIFGYWADLIGFVGLTLVVANTWGLDDGVPFRGQSAILAGPHVLDVADVVGDQVVRASR